MLDKRCYYKIRELQKFYLFIKHRSIYYAYYPQYKVTKSTGKTDIREAYKVAYDLLDDIQNKTNNKVLYKEIPNKKVNSCLKYILKFIDQDKELTSAAIAKLQQKLIETGASGKTVNNYIYALRKSYTGEFPNFTPCSHTAVYRSCFPITKFYNFYSNMDKTNRLHILAFFAMTTGCRLSEIKTCEIIDNRYIKINGTKTKNAVRIIPALPETISCIQYLQTGFRTAAYKESVIEAGRLCGFDEEYIAENNIVFHSFRKMYKTLLESCNIPNSFIEYYVGHSQTNTVNKLYFVGGSADDSDVYPKVIEALKKFI